MLCSACLRIFDDSPKIPSRANALRRTRLWMHHPYPYLLEAASQNGCQLCRILWDKFSQTEKDGLRATVPRISPIFSKQPLPLLAAILALTPFKKSLLITVTVCQLFDVIVRPIIGLVTPTWRLPRWLTVTLEPFHYLYRSVRFCFHGLEFDNYGWQVDLAAAEYQPLTVEFGFAALNWDFVPVVLLPAHDVRCSDRVRLPDGSEKVFYLQDRISQKPITSEMNSDENWELIRSWDGKCNANDPRHKSCHNYGTPGTSTLPSRLLDVSAGSEGRDIRLILTDSNREALQYVTLSYCWGKDTVQEALPLLRTVSLASYCQVIPYATLPLLFQDAIQTTRKFNLKYLWIDALCIIQDDENDMRNEMINMGNIYLRGVLNIAAGSSPNVHSPLVCERDPSFVEPLPVHIQWNSLAKKQKYRQVRKFFQGTHLVVDGRFMPANTQDCPLGRRAWVMQEQYLAPRIIHFGKHQLFWQCRSAQACETWPRGMPAMSPFLGYQGAAFGLLVSEPDRDLAGVDMNYQWWLLVELYSRREITNERDRFPAISALARLFSERICPDDDYVAGLWGSQLGASLCWSVHLGAGAPIRPSSRLRFAAVAPSWSWASVDAHIIPPIPREHFDHTGLDLWPLLLIEGAQLKMSTVDPRDPYGQIEVCKLKLTCGIIRSGNLRWLDRRAMGWKNPQNHQAIYGMGGTQFFPALMNVGIFFVCAFDVPDMEEAGKEWWTPGICKHPGIDLIPVRAWGNSREEYSSDGFIEGIAVRQCQSGAFRRIGYWRTIWNTHDGVYAKNLIPNEEEIILE